jgi:hypothetical protein
VISGKVKSIGVSNFGIPLLKTLLAQAKVVPVTNQVELHPCLPLVSVRKYCAEHGIVVTAYSPLGRPTTGQRLPTFLADEAVRGIATRLGATEAQVALSWAVQQGIVVVPKSENRERMKANIAVSSRTFCFSVIPISQNSTSSCIWNRPISWRSTGSISRRGCIGACSGTTRRMARSSGTLMSSSAGT